ncbi:bifunctional adenosylcobinamide kinase/adenosylcobinamide-phosphate guanylyltransferase [Draconibacterium halophilum]|uniref:Adenosylcobinamide kinase n=1 Tax=Draconibacterium halophilum TaxID=2706887 RepID=A0A6C0RFS9_9BACT|nr:bifunctional adenosylcobinamide kinase/adenosylcobinamide-phosphate guanylyltransferase [Draconibacterium halophilum]QIA08999.1 bifunctional adenosylcobinamide kinase/adenosylcobinamide-phosphate guanylyltransferase [Draconibacterium halophilum]
MAQITFITGGQRSGKSSFAQKRAEESSASPVYLATARIWDEDFHKRVKRHQSDRGEQWITIEEEIEISKHVLTGKTVLLDCITLWLTNIFYQNKNDVDTSLELAKREWNKFINQNMELFVVSNELGMGVHPENEMARKFADLQGWMNQYIAQTANEVFLMVSGIPIQVKASPDPHKGEGYEASYA